MGQILYTAVMSGDRVSGDVDLRKGTLRAVRIPTVTSGDLYVHGGFDATSASFGRLFNESGAILFPTGVGSNVALWPQHYSTPSYARFEFSVAQGDTRSLTIIRN